MNILIVLRHIVYKCLAFLGLSKLFPHLSSIFIPSYGIRSYLSMLKRSYLAPVFRVFYSRERRSADKPITKELAVPSEFYYPRIDTKVLCMYPNRIIKDKYIIVLHVPALKLFEYGIKGNKAAIYYNIEFRNALRFHLDLNTLYRVTIIRNKNCVNKNIT